MERCSKKTIAGISPRPCSDCLSASFSMSRQPALPPQAAADQLFPQGIPETRKSLSPIHGLRSRAESRDGDHVSRRASDTYYVNAENCLRAHTSAHQFSLMKQGLDNFLVIGDVYRRDEINSTHYPCFHQVEGVRLYSPEELFGNAQHRDFELFEDVERTKEKQGKLTEDATKALEISLKSTLEKLCDTFFGKCEKRWVDAYFPFTHPSYELEVFYESKWLEVLGCGVMEQKLLNDAGITDKAGWAFGIGLERIAMVLYGIPDIRLFWSRDSGFLSQFSGKAPEDTVKYQPISAYPQVTFDVSFFLPPNCEFNDMSADVYDTIRTVGGELIEQVELTDEFTNKKKNTKSQTYRIVYRSNDRVLTKEEVNIVHKEVEKQLIDQFGVKIR
ncbi:unnamed protein product, partial [Mesorhabditis spiculigera]